MNKGYAFGFLLVLLVLVLGFYVAYTGFTSSRESWRAQATATPVITATERVVVSQSSPSPTETSELLVLPTPLPGITATLTAVASISEEASPTPQVTQQATTEAAPTSPPRPSPTSTPVVLPPTTTPAPPYMFRLAGPPFADANYPSCCYIYGTVRDANGNGLEGVQVQIRNEWTAPALVSSKGGVDLGKYDIPIGRDVIDWYLVLVDPGGNAISPQVQIKFDPNAANGFRVDWQRTY